MKSKCEMPLLGKERIPLAGVSEQGEVCVGCYMLCRDFLDDEGCVKQLRSEVCRSAGSGQRLYGKRVTKVLLNTLEAFGVLLYWIRGWVGMFVAGRLYGRVSVCSGSRGSAALAERIPDGTGGQQQAPFDCWS